MLTDARDRQGAGPLVGEESRPPQLSDRDE
jgi:hypothetical protein